MASDGPIARHVIMVNMAHMASLVQSREVPRPTGAACIRFLLDASSEISPTAKAEDFHQQLEQDALDALGAEVAGYLNYGKSRNDQVATTIRMELRQRVLGLGASIAGLQGAILDLVRRHGTALLPGYTHLQRAQPVTLAHHFFAYFDAFQRDIERLAQLYSRANISPMGSAALGGTSVKVDRRLVADYLGFAGTTRNAMDAVSSRDLAVEALSFATLAMLDASRMAEEQILWSSKEFGFVELDDAFSASSSMMPQKKNAVVAETVRAKAGSVVGGLVAVCTILKALPYAYNLDLQEITPHLWRSLDDASASIRLLSGSVATMTINDKALRKSLANDLSTATALANYLVEEGRISFRQAHSVVGELVRLSIDKGITLEEASASYLGQVSARLAKKITIDEETAKRVLDPERFLRNVVTEGGSNPAFIGEGLNARARELSRNRAWLSKLDSSLKASQKRLLATAMELSKEVKTR